MCICFTISVILAGWGWSAKNTALQEQHWALFLSLQDRLGTSATHLPQTELSLPAQLWLFYPLLTLPMSPTPYLLSPLPQPMTPPTLVHVPYVFRDSTHCSTFPSPLISYPPTSEVSWRMAPKWWFSWNLLTDQCKWETKYWCSGNFFVQNCLSPLFSCQSFTVLLTIISQSLSTLTYVEKLLSQHQVPVPYSAPITILTPDGAGAVCYSNVRWTKNKNYCSKSVLKVSMLMIFCFVSFLD